LWYITHYALTTCDIVCVKHEMTRNAIISPCRAEEYYDIDSAAISLSVRKQFDHTTHYESKHSEVLHLFAH
jgi:hypothetical protein